MVLALFSIKTYTEIARKFSIDRACSNLRKLYGYELVSPTGEVVYRTQHAMQPTRGSGSGF